METEHLLSLLDRNSRPRVLVLGDLMLDRYIWGDVERISPEAPIPVLKVVAEEQRLGGAGSVAAMLTALQAEVVMVALVGDDAQGDAVRALLNKARVDPVHVLTAEGRRTTEKTRIIGRAQRRHPQQILRIDSEAVAPISVSLTEQLSANFQKALAQVQIVLVSDYGKGICTEGMLSQLIQSATRAGTPVIVDPYRGVDFRRYAGCTAVTPNRLEAGLAANMTINTPTEGMQAAERLLDCGLAATIVTMDKDGIAWACDDGRRGVFPARARNVYDITGAGDMVLAVLGFCVAQGCDFPEAITLSNVAAGLEVERFGAAPVTREEIRADLLREGRDSRTKIVTLEELDSILSPRREAGRQIVMTNGCFDLLHPGHVMSLRFARGQGDCLVVAVNSDASVGGLKGAGRPVIDQQGRAEMLAALECVDYVVVFNSLSVEPVVRRIRPDVLVKSAQYDDGKIVGKEFVEKSGGRVVVSPEHPAYSTSSLIRKIVAPSDPNGIREGGENRDGS